MADNHGPGKTSWRSALLPPSLYLGRSNVLTGRADVTALEKASPPSSNSPPPGGAFLPAAKEQIQLYSPTYFIACTAGGAIACGPTHMAVTPIDMVKVNMQTDPTKYKNIPTGFRIVYQELGLPGVVKGWLPTFVGYGFQGAFKYGGYEYFKKKYSDMVGPEFATKYRDLIYIAGSASAEVFADVALCPFEAIKVRVQTDPAYARGMIDGLPKLVATEGFGALYKGLVPLWGRQIPYTICKFYSFERTVEAMYKHVVPYPKEECSKGYQLGISFLSGYIAGIFCTLVSQPADNMVSVMNKKPGTSIGDVVKQLGMTGLFMRGLPLRIVQIGTLTGAQWAIYDSVKVALGLPTTGHVDEKKPPA